MLIIIVMMSGQEFFSEDQMIVLQRVFMPAYLLIAWIVIWYIIDLLGMKITDDSQTRSSNSSTAFIQGLVIGIFLALIYIFGW